MRPDAAKITAEAIAAVSKEEVGIAGKTYEISPPTIRRIARAGVYLADFGNEQNVKDSMREFVRYEQLTKALSCFIQGDECLSDELAEGTPDEVLSGIETAVRLIDVRNFIRLSDLTRNVKSLIARQR